MWSTIKYKTAKSNAILYKVKNKSLVTTHSSFTLQHTTYDVKVWNTTCKNKQTQFSSLQKILKWIVNKTAQCWGVVPMEVKQTWSMRKCIFKKKKKPKRHCISVKEWRCRITGEETRTCKSLIKLEQKCDLAFTALHCRCFN